MKYQKGFTRIVPLILVIVVMLAIGGAYITFNDNQKDVAKNEVGQNLPHSAELSPTSKPVSAETTKVGDKIGNLTVKEFKYIEDKSLPYIIEASYEGELIIEGTYGGNEVQGYCFNVTSENTPTFTERGGYRSFCFNYDDTLAQSSLFGGNLYSTGKARIIVDNYKTNYISTKYYSDTATLVKVLSKY